jgi:hypothetical protein
MFMRWLLLSLLIVNSAFAQPLDPPYEINPVVNDLNDKRLTSYNDIHKVIALQTPVKSQGSRGTCSIFSATALLESIFKREKSLELDLSEEWLEFIAMEGKTSEGSNAYTNYFLYSRKGMVLEKTWPYIGENWTSMFSTLAQDRCGHLEDDEETSCLLGHRSHKLLYVSEQELLNTASENYDPEFVTIRKSAKEFKQVHLDGFVGMGYPYLYSASQIKKLLDQKIPVIVGLRFFYGAWNHRLASGMGLGRNMEFFEKGVVGYPEPESLDYEVSTEEDNRAGHSIVIVGYDDNKVIQTKVKMKDGTEKEFSYRGVFYFKNSWGTQGFGSRFELDSKAYPGFGVITQKYALQHGSWFKLPVKYRVID